jgi:hypothetical protein
MSDAERRSLVDTTVRVHEQVLRPGGDVRDSSVRLHNQGIGSGATVQVWVYGSLVYPFNPRKRYRVWIEEA